MMPTKPTEKNWTGRSSCQSVLLELERGPLFTPNPAWAPEVTQRLEEIRAKCQEAESYLKPDIKARKEQLVPPSNKTWNLIREACEVWGELSGQAEAELDRKTVKKLDGLIGHLWGMIP